jgi:hypothetical protein
MRLIRVATLSIGFVLVFAAVALGQTGNRFEAVRASLNPTFREYNTMLLQLKSGKPPSIIAAFARASLPAGLRAQSEIPSARNTMDESLAAWNAMFEAREPESGKSTVPEGQAMLQLGILQMPERAAVKRWSMAKISTHTQRAEPKRWITVGPGLPPLATTIQPDDTQKYGADPPTLQVYFGHRR